MKVLIACEESQTICKAFRAKGHEAYSNDIVDCSGNHPEWHIQGDAIEALYSKNWDLVIAHPPCTRLANSGVCWLDKKGLWKDMERGAEFFYKFVKYGKAGNKIAIENPVPHKYAVEIIGPYTQIIQPYQFGHAERKATCLWLFGIPELIYTNNVYEQMKILPKNQAQRLHYLPPSPERAKLRSKTYEGIAKAMAEQWG